MTLKKYSPDAFTAMFWRSAKKICVVPIFAFAVLVFKSMTSLIYAVRDNDIIGYFWNDLGMVSGILFGLIFGFAGVLSGVLLFNFVLSKKQCNVVFSLGLSRRKIFLANYLAGIIPFYAAIIFAAFFELFGVFCNGYAITASIVEIAIYYVVSILSVYTLAYTMTAVAFAFSGNIFEALVFSLVFAIFPRGMEMLFCHMRSLFTHGGVGIYEGNWNIFNLFFNFGEFAQADSEYYVSSPMLSNYFFKMLDGKQYYKLNIYDFSGAITAFVFSAIIFAVGFVFFKKRRNEISGTFGRAKGLNEICGVLVGLYAVAYGMGMYNGTNDSHGQGNVLTFLLMLVVFVIVMLVFKMIFGYKRKLVIKRMLKTVPIYAVVLAIVTTVFSTGLLGYSSSIPNEDNVSYIEFMVDTVNPNCERCGYTGIHRSPVYGYANMKRVVSQSLLDVNNLGGNVEYYTASDYSRFTVTNQNDIKKLISIHKKFVEDGKIKDSASNSCGINFQIVYHLTNDKQVIRYYSETTEATALEVLGLSELDCVREGIDGGFSRSFDELYDPDDESENKTEEPIGVYALAKDLKNAHYIGVSTSELEKAVNADLKNQSVADVFFHKAEDEIGVLCFGLSYITDYGYDDVTQGYYWEQDLPDLEDMKVGDSVDANISVTSEEFQTFVITKDMTNTIKYLTDKGLMKYFESDFTVNDIKCVKLATKAQSVGEDNSTMLPLFAGAYSTAIENEMKDRHAKQYNYVSSHYFEHNVNNEITNKTTIQKILDNSFLYGYCGNDYRIAEVTYIDGSIATYCITSEVYNSLMK